MNPVYDKLLRCYDSVKDRIPFAPDVALVLGSGLGDYADHIQVEAAIDYHEIEGFPVSTVPGHKGRFVFSHIEGVPVVLMQGRVHYYEGYAMTDVVLPIRLMKLMGARILFLTNASGGVNFDFAAGDLMLIRDQISSLVPSPLIGPNLDELGPRFPDMSHIYDEDLRSLIRECAAELDIPLREGVYVQFTGPAYESPQEVRMCRSLGGDACGMSTACEAVAANHMGMKICGISCISNLACGMTDQPLSHKEVQETADRVAPRFRELVTRVIGRMGSL
ncbi:MULTISPECIES: purine-nucleoside phosphorylase [Enterocloster]|uniref:Purine nucleoside phosphorylase n=1 Tax=Enterocloster lavalensis TaxID=460384 RepID=A0A1I0JQR4_9FIRM|nr:MULTISPECIES: purine-nucleoside phosphorylase [Enterocloster]MDR3756752.1 purine-nucleoside phosphorylase [Enterocloster sp.]SEU12180.1 purine-nucleoside phosphorylase [Enterocloster lavalensis]